MLIWITVLHFEYWSVMVGNKLISYLIAKMGFFNPMTWSTLSLSFTISLTHSFSVSLTHFLSLCLFHSLSHKYNDHLIQPVLKYSDRLLGLCGVGHTHVHSPSTLLLLLLLLLPLPDLLVQLALFLLLFFNLLVAIIYKVNPNKTNENIIMMRIQTK